MAADTIRLRYGELAKPVLADRNGEAVSNWTGAGNHSITADATHAYTGTKSYKIVATNTGDFTTNYVQLASGSNGTFVVGKQYVLTIYTYSTPGVTFQIKTGGVTSATLISTASGWTTNHFTFTDVTATTALQIAVVEVGTEPYDLWFEIEPIQEYVSLTVLAERGMSDPDAVEFFPALQNRYLDGTMEDYIEAFRRKIWLDCGIVHDSMDRRRILYWLIDNDRTVDYDTEVNVPLCLGDVGGFENTWDQNTRLLRHYSFALLEPSVRTTFPV